MTLRRRGEEGGGGGGGDHPHAAPLRRRRDYSCMQPLPAPGRAPAAVRGVPQKLPEPSGIRSRSWVSRLILMRRGSGRRASERGRRQVANLGGRVRKRWREGGGRRYEGASWPSDLWSDGGGFSGFSVMGFERCQIGSQEALFVSEMDIRRITCVLKNVKFWIDIFIVKCMFDKALSLLELELNQTVSDSPYRDVYYKRNVRVFFNWWRHWF